LGFTGVIPDTEVQQMLTNVFGSQSYPMRKASRMLYWMPKFRNLSPWPIPEPLPDGSLELAKLAIQRITSVDLSTKITIYDVSGIRNGWW
jgi:signaling intermediate in Toll pathway protein